MSGACAADLLEQGIFRTNRQMNQTWHTRYSLIEEMQHTNDHRAWDTFVQHYRPFIYFLLNQMEVRVSEQDDLVQEILIKLHKNLPQYVKERGRFRTWLGTVIRNTAKNYITKQSRLRQKHDEICTSLEVINSYSQSELEKRIDSEWKQYVANTAMDHLKTVFSEQVIDCFQMTLDNVPVEEIARRLHVKKDTVYIIRTRMKTRVLQEMKKLIDQLEF